MPRTWTVTPGGTTSFRRYSSADPSAGFTGVTQDSFQAIPVSCVERGRWAYRATHFAGTGSSSHSALRRQMHEQVTRIFLIVDQHDSNAGERRNPCRQRRSAVAGALDERLWRIFDRQSCELGAR